MTGCPAQSEAMDTLDRLLSVQDLADYLGVPVATIYTWRHNGHGPPGFRVRRHLRFRTSDVAHWITQHLDQHHQATSMSHPTRRVPSRESGG
jgi:excisionase family DNA binding protein